MILVQVKEHQIVQCYPPTETSDIEKKDDFYEQLNEIQKKITGDCER